MRLDYFFYYKVFKSLRSKIYAASFLRLIGKRHLVVRMDMANGCNLRCPMCHYPSRMAGRKITNLTKEQIDRIAKQLFMKTRNVHLSCTYEPMMSENFIYALEKVREYGIPFSSTVSNGQLLSRKIVEAICDLELKELVLSVDSPNEKTYNMIRGGGYDRLLNCLEGLNETKRRKNSPYPKLKFNSVLMKENIEQVPDLIEFASKAGAKYLQLRHLGYHEDASIDFDAQTLFNYPKLANDIIGRAKKIAGDKGIFLDAPKPIRENESFDSDNVDASVSCAYPWFQVLIRINGDVAPCAYWKGEHLGNVFNEDFSDIWKNGFKKLRSGVSSGKLPPNCEKCSVNGPAKYIGQWAIPPVIPKNK